MASLQERKDLQSNQSKVSGCKSVCGIYIFPFVCLASSRKRRKGSGPPGSNSQDPQPKNAVAILNELKKNLVYELESQEGPYHAPVFTMSVLVNMPRVKSCEKVAKILHCIARLTVKST